MGTSVPPRGFQALPTICGLDRSAVREAAVPPPPDHQGTIKVIQACAGGITFAAATPALVVLARSVGTFHIPSACGIGSYRLHVDAVRLARHGPGTFPDNDSG